RGTVAIKQKRLFQMEVELYDMLVRQLQSRGACNRIVIPNTRYFSPREINEVNNGFGFNKATSPNDWLIQSSLPKLNHYCNFLLGDHRCAASRNSAIVSSLPSALLE